MSANLPREDEFDEAAYLAAYPDVRTAVELGHFESGRSHYEQCGKAEDRLGRPQGLPLPRRDKLVGGLDLKHMVGLEIGPLMTPIVRKEEGSVFYIDHADTETLRSKYTHDDGVDVSKIVEVDMVWGTNSLQDCIGHDRKVDYVVNSHVIEHVPDLVSWLQEIYSVLRPDGQLRMAIPDRRFTFDFLRRELTLGEALDAYIRRTRVPLPRAILDHFLHYTEIDLGKAWQGQLQPGDVRPVHSPQFALEVAERCFRSGEYQDTHCWVFTPQSFVDLCTELAKLELLKLACVRLHATSFMEIEFFAALRPATSASECVASWQIAGEQLRRQASTAPRPTAAWRGLWRRL